MAQVAHLALLPLGPGAGWEWSWWAPQGTLGGNPVLLGPHWLASRPETLRLQAGPRGGPSVSCCFLLLLPLLLCVQWCCVGLPDLMLPGTDRRILCWVFFDIALLPNHMVLCFLGGCGLFCVGSLVSESWVWESCLWAIPRSQSGAS